MATYRARELRCRMTDAEALLWHHLRGRRLAGAKFRRQYSIGPYYVDFVSLKHKLSIEVDGGQHLTNEKTDRKRTDFLNGKGYTVLRFWNHDVLTDSEAVLERILASLGERGAPSP